MSSNTFFKMSLLVSKKQVLSLLYKKESLISSSLFRLRNKCSGKYYVNMKFYINFVRFKYFSTNPSFFTRHDIKVTTVSDIYETNYLLPVTEESKGSKKKTIRQQLKSLPNIITMSRIFCTPILSHFILIERYDIATLLLFFCASSDWLDGYIARHYKCKTFLGFFLDPIADKCIINAVALSLSYNNIIPNWASSMWFGRDIIIIAASSYYLTLLTKKHGHSSFNGDIFQLEVKPTLISKINTALQFSTIGLSIGQGMDCVSFDMVQLFCWLTVGTTISSGLGYIDGKSISCRSNEITMTKV